MKREQIEALNDLTSKQRHFVLAYIQTQNATQACKLAGYKGDTLTLGSIGTENLHKPLIMKAIAVLEQEIIEKYDVSIERIITEIAGIGYAKEGVGLTDKLRALKLLGDHAGAWKDQSVNLNHTGEINIITQVPDPE